MPYPELRPGRLSPAKFVLIALLLAAFLSARAIASLVIEYQWWKEIGQLPTWFEMIWYRVAPVAAEIRARTQKILRGGAAYEGARH